MLTVFLILALCAFGCAIYSAVKPERSLLWVAVILLSIIALLQSLPLGR